VRKRTAIVPRYYVGRDARYRFSTEGHFDLMDFLVEHRATRGYSLNLAAKLIGMPGKMDTKGSDVAEMVAAGRIEEVISYCLSDVAQTAAGARRQGAPRARSRSRCLAASERNVPAPQAGSSTTTPPPSRGAAVT
jgi:predicted PolB exonuclease-like 3'-5' exonuclease